MKVAPGEKPRNTNQQQSEESSQPALDPITGLCNQSELPSGLCKSIRWPAAHSWPRDQSQRHHSPAPTATWCTPPPSAEAWGSGPRSSTMSMSSSVLPYWVLVFVPLTKNLPHFHGRGCCQSLRGHAPFWLTRRGRSCGLQVKLWFFHSVNVGRQDSVIS